MLLTLLSRNPISIGNTEVFSCVLNIATASTPSYLSPLSLSITCDIVPLGNYTFGKTLTLTIQNNIVTLGTLNLLPFTLTLSNIERFGANSGSDSVGALTLTIIEALTAAGYIVGSDGYLVLNEHITQALMTNALIGETFLVPSLVNEYLTLATFTNESINV